MPPTRARSHTFTCGSSDIVSPPNVLIKKPELDQNSDNESALGNSYRGGALSPAPAPTPKRISSFSQMLKALPGLNIGQLNEDDTDSTVSTFYRIIVLGSDSGSSMPTSPSASFSIPRPRALSLSSSGSNNFERLSFDKWQYSVQLPRNLDLSSAEKIQAIANILKISIPENHPIGDALIAIRSELQSGAIAELSNQLRELKSLGYKHQSDIGYLFSAINKPEPPLDYNAKEMFSQIFSSLVSFHSAAHGITGDMVQASTSTAASLTSGASGIPVIGLFFGMISVALGLHDIKSKQDTCNAFLQSVGLSVPKKFKSFESFAEAMSIVAFTKLSKDDYGNLMKIIDRLRLFSDEAHSKFASCMNKYCGNNVREDIRSTPQENKIRSDSLVQIMIGAIIKGVKTPEGWEWFLKSFIDCNTKNPGHIFTVNRESCKEAAKEISERHNLPYKPGFCYNVSFQASQEVTNDIEKSLIQDIQSNIPPHFQARHIRVTRVIDSQEHSALYPMIKRIEELCKAAVSIANENQTIFGTKSLYAFAACIFSAMLNREDGVVMALSNSNSTEDSPAKLVGSLPYEPYE